MFVFFPDNIKLNITRPRALLQEDFKDTYKNQQLNKKQTPSNMSGGTVSIIQPTDNDWDDEYKYHHMKEDGTGTSVKKTKNMDQRRSPTYCQS